MNYVFQKTINNGSKTLDSSNITVAGVDLSATINQILQDNVTDSANFAGCATLAGTNAFTGTNTMNALTIPSSMAVSSSAISLSKLPRLASTLTPSDPKDLATKQYTDDAGGAVRTNLLGTYNTWSNTNNFTSGFMIGGGLTFSPSNLVFNKMPTTDIDRTSEIIDDKNFVVKKYVDDKFTTKTGTNTCTGFNEFQGGLRVRYMFTADDSGMTFTTVPKTTSDLTHLMNDDNHFITKKYLDLGKAALIASGNDYTGENTFTHITVPNCCGLTQADGAIFSVIPKTDADRTSEIVDERQFVTKKFVDNKFTSNNNFGTTTQTMFNNTVTNKLVVAYSMEAPLNAPVQFSYVPTLTGDFTASITDDKQIVNKKYVDDKLSTVPITKLQTDRFIVADTTTSYINTAGGYRIVPPKVKTGGGYHTFYINFNSSINANGKDNILLSQSCFLDFDYYFTQAGAMSNIIVTSNASPWLSQYVRSTSGAPNNSSITMATMATNRASPITAISSQYILSTNEGKVCVSSGYQAIILYVKPVAGKLTPAPSTISTKYNATTITGSPLIFTYVNDNKIKVEIWFPLINNNTSTNNDPSLNDWISSYGCSVQIKASPIFYDQSLGNTVFGPEMNSELNTDSGMAYITLT